MKSVMQNRFLSMLFIAMHRTRVLRAIILAGAVVSACDVHSASSVSSPAALASITVTPNTTLAASAVQQMVAVGHDANGGVVAITPTWSVAALGGTINAAGMFSAGTLAGVFPNTVVASVGLISGSASITVTAGALASITVAPATATVAAGAKQQFIAAAKDAGGNIVQFTPTWTVLAGGGTIDALGNFTAGGTPGTYVNTVQASSNGVKTLVTITVIVGPLASIQVSPSPVTMAVNGTQQFSAVGTDAAGNPVVMTTAWTVVAGGGTISAAGLFTAGTVAGTFVNTVSASSGGVSAAATIIVTTGPLASIAVTPNPVSLAINATQTFVAVGKDANGNVIAITPTWAITNGGGAISATGVFTAGATAGVFASTIRASSGTIAGSASVTVIVPPPTPPGPPVIVNLATAAPNGIMAGTAVTCVTGGTINANVSVSPGNAISGFGPCVITGVQHLGDAVALQGQVDLTAAYNMLAGIPCAASNIIAANLGGTTKSAGVYCSASGISVSGVLTLDAGGDPNATFVFQAGSSLVTAGNVVLVNGAQAKNVYWLVGSSATLGTSSQWKGNILALTSITLVDNATLNGRALARNGAVTLGTNNTITLP